MAKSKKSKILAMALCASVMTGIYASPVMADGQISGINVVTSGTGAVLQADNTVSINGVELEILPDGTNGKVKAAGGRFTQLTVTNGMEITEGGLTVGDTTSGVTTSIDSATGNTVVGGTLTAARLASLNGGLNVTGGATVNGGMTVNDKATVNGMLTASDGLTVTNNGIKVEEGGLTVEMGDTVLNDLSAGTTTLDRLTVTDGQAVFKKGAFVEDELYADKAKVGAAGLEVVGDTTLKSTLKVNGQTTLNGLTVNDEANFTNGATVQNGLSVTGDSSVAGNFEVTNGGLKVAKGIEAANGTFKLTEEGKLTVGGEATFTEGATVQNGLTVTGNTTLANTTVDGTLNVTDKLTANKGLKVTNGTETDTLTVTSAAKVNSLEVDKGIKAANGKFDLTEAGVLTVNGEAYFTKGATVQNGLTVTGDSSVAGNFAVTNGGLSVSGGESVLNGGLTVNNGDTKLNGKLDVGAGNFKVDTDGNTEFNGNLNIGHDAFEVTAADGSFSAARENFKVSADGVINADSLYLQTYGGGTLEVGEALQALTDAKLPDKVGGIERDPAGAGDPGNGTTTIESGAEFTETAMTMGDTIVESGKITVGAADDQTIIKGGAITAKSLMLDGKDVGKTITGIERDPENEVTTIEGATSFDANGMSIKDADGFGTSLGVAGMDITAAGGLKTSFTAGGATFVGASGTTTINGGAIETTTINGVNFTQWHDAVDGRLDKLEYKTQNINGSEGTSAGTGEGGTAAGESIDVPATEDGHTGINGNVTVGGEINAGEIVVGDKDSDNKTTIDGGNITTGDTTIDGDGIKTGNGDFSGEVNVGDNTNITGDGITTGNGNFAGDVDVDGKVTVGDGTTITGEGITTGTGTFDDVIIGGNTTIDSDGIKTNDITAGTGTIGNVDMNNTGIIVGGGTTITEDTVTTDNIKADDGEFDSQVTVGDKTTITDGNINLGDDNGTNINADGMIVGNANGVNTNVSAGDVVITDKDGKDIALSDVGYVENIDRELQANGNYDGTVVGGINAEADIRRAEVNRLDNRISKVEDRVDKVGAMSAAIANLRTMGYDPAAPTEIAVGVGQYRSETGVALGMFHYPNKDFMLSLSVSTSGDEVMGGIGATWKFGRKSPEKVLAAEKEKAAKAKLAKAEAMKKAAKEAKIKAQQERHAKLAAERAAQAEAAK